MNKKGFALLLALLTLIIVSLLVTAYIELTTTDLQIISNHFTRNKALYIADAGVEYAIYNLRINNRWQANNLSVIFPQGTADKYSVTYPRNSGKITSTGVLATGQQVRLEARISVGGSSRPYTVKILSWKEI